MSEDLTGCLTNGSTTVMSSLTIRVLSTRGSHAHIKTCSNALQLNFHLMIAAHTHTELAVIFAGDIVSVYRKSHLFDVELPEKGVSLKESAFTIPGPTLVSPVQTPIGKV